LEPANLGGKVRRIENDPAPLEYKLGIDAGNLVIGAAIHPDEARIDGQAVASDPDTTVELPRKTERLYLRCPNAARRERAGNRRAKRLLPQCRILLSPSGARKIRLVVDRMLAEHCELGRHDQRLETLRADIGTDDHAARSAGLRSAM